MTDEPSSDNPEFPPAPPPAASNGVSPTRANGRGAQAPETNRATVRSGLAKRRSPVLATIGAGLQSARRIAFRDPIALFLLLASIALAITFAALLGSIAPSSAGQQVPLSTVHKLAGRHQIATALLLDHDNRVELVTTAKAPRSRPTERSSSPRRRSRQVGSGPLAELLLSPFPTVWSVPRCFGPPTRHPARRPSS